MYNPELIAAVAAVFEAPVAKELADQAVALQEAGGKALERQAVELEKILLSRDKWQVMSRPLGNGFACGSERWNTCSGADCLQHTHTTHARACGAGRTVYRFAGGAAPAGRVRPGGAMPGPLPRHPHGRRPLDQLGKGPGRLGGAHGPADQGVGRTG